MTYTNVFLRKDLRTIVMQLPFGSPVAQTVEIHTCTFLIIVMLEQSHRYMSHVPVSKTWREPFLCNAVYFWQDPNSGAGPINVKIHD